MRYKGKVQYVRYYTSGAAAQKVIVSPGARPRPAENPIPANAKPKQKTPAMVVEPFALIGTAVAVVLAITVLFGLYRLHQANRQETAMAEYIQTLSAENEDLQERYRSGYDAEEIRKTAEALGLVPRDQVEHIRVEVTRPVIQPEPTFWETFWAEVQELFA